MPKALKLKAIKLAYLEIKRMETKEINTHSLIAEGGMKSTYMYTKTGRFKKGSIKVRNIQLIHPIPIEFILQRDVI